MNFLSEKKYGVPSLNFVKKNVLCEKGDEITRFDGTQPPTATGLAPIPAHISYLAILLAIVPQTSLT
jgi:hypothetical protein